MHGVTSQRTPQAIFVDEEVELTIKGRAWRLRDASGRPSDTDIRDCIEKFAELADSAQKGCRWIRRAGSQSSAYTVEEVGRGYKRVYDYTTEDTRRELSGDAEGHARRAVARRADQRTLASVNRSPPEAVYNLAHRSRRRRRMSCLC